MLFDIRLWYSFAANRKASSKNRKASWKFPSKDVGVLPKSVDSVRKQVVQYDHDGQTVTWLDCCETGIEAGVKVVSQLKCRVCAKYINRIVGCSNACSNAVILFSLPVSNGKLERTFSQVNLIKCNNRAFLGSDTLNDLLTKFHRKSFHLKLLSISGGVLRLESRNVPSHG